MTDVRGGGSSAIVQFANIDDATKAVNSKTPIIIAGRELQIKYLRHFNSEVEYHGHNNSEEVRKLVDPDGTLGVESSPRTPDFSAHFSLAHLRPLIFLISSYYL
jgi:RNA recognition motif-containing protein